MRRFDNWAECNAVQHQCNRLIDQQQCEVQLEDINNNSDYLFGNSEITTGFCTDESDMAQKGNL